MEKIDVKLKVSRAGVDFTQVKGDVVPVGLLEAGRLLRQGAIEAPDAKTIKAIAKAEKAAEIETAAADPVPVEASANPPASEEPAQPGGGDPAPADPGQDETANGAGA